MTYCGEILIDPTSSLFVYGTLLFPEVMAAVTGRRWRSVAAVLQGYARYQVKGQVFPGICRRPGAVVFGVVYSDLDERSWRCLDYFEGDFYRRRSLTVTLPNRQPKKDSREFTGGQGVLPGGLGADAVTRQVQVYVMPPSHQHLLSTRLWSAAEFRLKHLSRYLRHCHRTMARRKWA